MSTMKPQLIGAVGDGRMRIRITARGRPDEWVNLYVNRTPGTCPSCRLNIDPAFVGASVYPDDFSPLYVAYQCPVEKCRALFVATYRVTKAPPNEDVTELLLSPPLFWTEEAHFPPMVEAISPTFVNIYNQASRVEQNNLDQVADPGYRKALEHLIKDYLCKDEAIKQDVLKSLLGRCIEQYVDDPRLKAVAKRAAWLGNDETHYLRKWTDKDIQDLKNLIRMTVNWIDLVETSKQYVDSMPE